MCPSDVSDSYSKWIARLRTIDHFSPTEIESLCQWFERAVAESWSRAIEIPLHLAAWPPSADRERLLQPVLKVFAAQLRQRDAAAVHELLAEESVLRVGELYRKLGRGYPNRHLLLQPLAAWDLPTSFRSLADILANDPPAEPQVAVSIVAMLMRTTKSHVCALFPRLLDALEHAALATAVLDLCNFYTREGVLPVHPALDRRERLGELMRRTTRGLAALETETRNAGTTLAQHEETISQAIALLISLCDAAGLMGDRNLIGPLEEALELRHRRLRVEAAAALARLQDPRGVDLLVAMAEEPSERLRVIRYLEELGLRTRLPSEFTSATALGEAELASWLSSPNQFGVAPSSLSLVDSRRLYWPGYKDPRECRLFGYTYRTSGGDLHGIGLVGPVTWSFAADFSDLPPSEIYAAFAGWQAEHDEIREYDVAESDRSTFGRWRQPRDLLTAQGYDALRLERVGHVFSDLVAVASAERNGLSGPAGVIGDRVYWYPQRPGCKRPLSADDVFHIMKGRILLETFNPGLFRATNDE